MSFSVTSSYLKLRSIVDSNVAQPLPSKELITTAACSLATSLPPIGLGEEAVEAHLLQDILPGLNGSKTSANYYGFVTGGVLPIAEAADNIVTAFDQNAAVHLPDQSVSTLVEDRALQMLAELLNLGEGWGGKLFTTGATASNVLGLACGREAVIERRLKALGSSASVGELGFLSACAKAKVHTIQVLTAMGHSSLYKAASIVGLGRASVKDIPISTMDPWLLSLRLLEQELKRFDEGVLSIVVLSAGEVNTGLFATSSHEGLRDIREMCNRYGAWLHVDGAFGLFARCLPDDRDFILLKTISSGLEVADSITADCHKMLNVPYDCGVFFTRSASVLTSVFQNPNAAYLSSNPSDIPSPLNIGLENSRRFRALPVYAVLQAYGENGLASMFGKQVYLARAIARYLEASSHYELLPRRITTDSPDSQRDLHAVHIIVLFRAKDEELNTMLVEKINATRKIYVSGTVWDGKPACRIAVSTWKVDVERDTKLIIEVLGGAAA